ncbi:tRNA-guanine transglycosylase [Haladaptatus sp. YSMS36]|uniref:tRNA-guanine transglycosylase n=1 Tax=Haladaptatus sp. YSMS36 TaxID=3033384 RepID=UPI0023E8EE48|nr:tRNA-guanine transglycosylase [Haladaptatus sp. YSMS36]
MAQGFEAHRDANLGHGRTGQLHTPEAPSGGSIDTPAFFPVLNLIGGPTPVSGGIWSRLRNRLFGDDAFQGAVFQAMSFLDFSMKPHHVNKWRKQGLHDWFTGHDSPKSNPDPPPFTQPLFVDSGGFKLMNSRVFGESPDEGGAENEWGIYTNPDSILELQNDYGSDVIATLDYPIPKDLNQAEKEQRIEDSIDSAVRCIELLQEHERYADWNPVVYAAIHGHSYEEIAYYVSQLLERTKYPDAIDGFAVGSLVPLRTVNIEMIVDIVQGAADAIPKERRDTLALHAFGIGGRIAPLIAALGVDSYDSSTYVQAAQHKKFVDPETWAKVAADEIDNEWSCTCPACEELTEVGIQDMQEVFQADRSYKPVTIERDGYSREYMKSDFYALIAHHNFHMYQREINEVRDAINEGALTSLLEQAAADNADLKKGLARAATRWPELRSLLPEDSDVGPAPEEQTQTVQSQFGPGGNPIAPSETEISLNHSHTDFDLRERNFTPASDARVCLILPCSNDKPYGESRTHKVVENRLVEAGTWDSVEKVTVSGLYGPVPHSFETEHPVMTYDYVLTETDTEQMERVNDRLQAFLQSYGSEYDAVFGYATSKTYRKAIERALKRTKTGTILPENPPARRLTEHFRNEHLEELSCAIEAALSQTS